MTEDPRAQLEILRERRIKATGGGKTRMTDYVILESSNGNQWQVLGSEKAVSAKAAIAALLKNADQKDGEFIAVPARSWQPVTVKKETRLKFS